MRTICYLFAAYLLLPLSVQAQHSPPPLIPVGLDTYRRWDQWPLQRTGVRAYMRSTYDRNGGNESADASHFLFMKAEDYDVTLDVAGRGILYFFRANHWHGSPWHFVADSIDNIVQESGTADPVNAKKRFTNTTFLRKKPFRGRWRGPGRLPKGPILSEQQHDYESPEASAVEQLISRYEWGIDVFPAAPWGMDLLKLPDYAKKAGKELYPAQTAGGRYTRGTSAFTVKLAPGNTGVLLRRMLDYSFPNQKAAVYVATADKSVDSATWEYAGTWYLAGSNTCMYSDPRGELERRQLTTQTSNRRFRDDEFMIPAALTKGRSAIRIKVQHTPVEQELFPGFPFPKRSAWSELKYDVYSYVLPAVKK